MIETPQTWLARNAARLAIYTLLAVLLAVAFFTIKGWRDDAKTRGEAIEKRDATATATTGIAQDLGEATAQSRAVEVHISNDTRALTAALEALRNEKPNVDAWLDAPVPDELRQLAREKRESRDRLGLAADGSNRADAGAPAPGAGNPN